MYRVIINPNINTHIAAIAAIGSFDGLHLGHISLLKRLNGIAKDYNYRKVMITFQPLPSEYFALNKERSTLLKLGLLRDKFAILQQLELIDELVIIRFNQVFRNMAPQQFIAQFLKNKLKVKHVVVGHDFRFGKNASGSVDDFRANKIDVTVVSQFNIDGNRVSSSLIRNFASNNNLVQVKKYLGRNLRFTSKVIYGNKLGRRFGVPTINLSLGHTYPALWGIYVAYVYIDKVRYGAVASIGKNPTVSLEDSYKLEAHLLDIDLNLYGKIAVVEFLCFLRPERRFSNLDKLFIQIRQDMQEARDYFVKINDGL